jgi:hypothetical protein
MANRTRADAANDQRTTAPDNPQATGPVTAPDPKAKPTEVEAGTPRTLPPLGAPARIAASEISPAERISIGEGSSAQVNSGAALTSQIFGPEEEDEEDDEDDGPKLVVLHTYVTGPGGGPYVRGKVITVFQLLGHNLLKPENRRVARRTLKRYLEEQGGVGPSVRPATVEEAKHDFVTFPEGEVALTSALDDANTRADEAQRRADELQRQLDELRGNQGDVQGTADNADVDSLLGGARSAEGGEGTNEDDSDF